MKSHFHQGSQERDSEKHLCQSEKKGPGFPPPAFSLLPACCCLRQKESLYLLRVFWGHLGLGFQLLGKSLNFLNQVGTWCLAQHPFGDTGSQSSADSFLLHLPSAPFLRDEMVRAVPFTFLPPAGLGAWLPQLALLGPPAIPQQDPLLCLARALGTSPPALQSTFTCVQVLANHLKPAEDRDSALANACPLESPEHPFFLAAAISPIEADVPPPRPPTPPGSQLVPWPQDALFSGLAGHWLEALG